MKLVLSCIILLLATEVLSQHTWDKGYFINNEGERIECLIKSLDGFNSPRKIEYKLTNLENPADLTPGDIREFGVIGQVVFISATVDIDRSKNDLNQASSSRNPEWSQETLFLRTLVNGEASLYVYSVPNFTRFFYRVKDGPIEQLVYKMFYAFSDKIAYNKTYLVQLQQALKCDKIPEKIDVPYAAKPLESLFKKYNECKGVAPLEESTDKKFAVITDFTFRPGLNLSKYSALAMLEPDFEFYADFMLKVTPRFGIEMEIYPVLNNRNKKWSIVFEPNFRFYNDEYTIDNKLYTIKYSSIEFPIGIRRYFYLPERKALFVNINAVYDKPIGNSGGQIPTNFINGYIIEYSIIPTRITYAAGLGFLANRFLGEFRFYMSRSNAEGGAAFSSTYMNGALVLGYRLRRIRSR